MACLEGYELSEQKSRSQFSILYKARRVLDNQLVIVRLLPRALYPNSEIESLSYQTMVQCCLDHPNLQKSIELIPTHEGVWQVLEYVDGPTLEETLAGVPMAVQARLEAALGVARAVGYMHKYLIVHCNLAPSNIFLPEGRPGKIAGFGYAINLAFDADQVASGVSVPQHQMAPNGKAPEQLTGAVDKICPATDVFGLGLIIYQLMTWSKDFPASVGLEKSAMDLSQGNPISGVLLPSCSPLLESICRRSLQKYPADRYTDANPLAKDLEKVLVGL